jgi:Arm DNA-binding domain
MFGSGWLTALAVSSLSETGMHPHGGGPYLQISKTGARSWVFRFKQDGHERYMGLGPFHAVSLADVRQKATEARSQLLILSRRGTLPDKPPRALAHHSRRALSPTLQITGQRGQASVTPSNGKKRWKRMSMLPARSKLQVVKHHPAMPYDKLPIHGAAT